MAWENYKREESTKEALGKRRCVITGAEEATSKSGNAMIVVTIRPSGTKIDIKHFLVDGEYFNKNATKLFDSFDIEDGNFNLIEWIGAMGAAEFTIDDDGYHKIKWFIDKTRAETLPAFEGEKPPRQTVTKFEELGDDEDAPF